MFRTVKELLDYHGRLTDTYVAVKKKGYGYDLYMQSNAGLPKYDEYYYKISGDIRFENIDWDDEDDGIRHYQIWEIEPKDDNRLYIIFDIGSVDVVFGEVQITPLTKEEYDLIDGNS